MPMVTSWEERAEAATGVAIWRWCAGGRARAGIISSLLLTLTCGGGAQAWAATAGRLIPYQGRLSGVTSAQAVTLGFRLFNRAGTAIWGPESSAIVTDGSGGFNAVIGGSGLDVNNDGVADLDVLPFPADGLELEVSVTMGGGPSTVLTPRQRLLPAAEAFSVVDGAISGSKLASDVNARFSGLQAQIDAVKALLPEYLGRGTFNQPCSWVFSSQVPAAPTTINCAGASVTDKLASTTSAPQIRVPSPKAGTYIISVDTNIMNHNGGGGRGRCQVVDENSTVVAQSTSTTYTNGTTTAIRFPITMTGAVTYQNAAAFHEFTVLCACNNNGPCNTLMGDGGDGPALVINVTRLPIAGS